MYENHHQSQATECLYLPIVFFNVQKASSSHFCREHVSQSTQTFCYCYVKESGGRSKRSAAAEIHRNAVHSVWVRLTVHLCDF